ncbi:MULTISPECIES: hypothetical protein [unclassified Pseudonocardia]|uniref:hypothetical protein n=1 Tax=unclassified Pseudonocardia TaxID=2619320 RepID=UPI0001FFDD31|nr:MULTISPECIES: hypothetical protein [unclassified Pseudonocardia]OLM16461.1 hypothetical protein Ae707Ps1_0719 [Pseudonocardia sp. Ae707_Ps1]
MLIDNAVATVQMVATGFVVPAQDRPPPPGQLPEWGNAAPVGLAIVLVLLLATVLLIRNMSKRIKRLPESFEEQPAAGTDDEADSRSS